MTPTTEFKREDKYLVVKRKDLEKLSPLSKLKLAEWLADNAHALPQRQYVVVESDWPEYDTVFKMIEARVTGNPFVERDALKPLTLEQIDQHIGIDEGDREAVIDIVREVEEMHGIGTDQSIVARYTLCHDTGEESPDWKAIALALGQRVNFSMQYCDCKDGALMNMETGQLQAWRDYMAEGMEMIPGVIVDREILGTLSLPKQKRKAAQAAIRAKRAEAKP